LSPSLIRALIMRSSTVASTASTPHQRSTSAWFAAKGAITCATASCRRATADFSRRISSPTAPTTSSSSASPATRCVAHPVLPRASLRAFLFGRQSSLPIFSLKPGAPPSATQKAQRSADEIKRELAAEHGVPLNPPPVWLPAPAARVSCGSQGSVAHCEALGPALASEDVAAVAIPEANQRSGIHAFNARRSAQVRAAEGLFYYA